jgi:hypothetical protein
MLKLPRMTPYAEQLDVGRMIIGFVRIDVMGMQKALM